LPSAACSFTPAGTEVIGHVPFFTVGRNLCGDFGLPVGKQIQLVWGTVALFWIAFFALSSHPVLLAFFWAPLFAFIFLWERLRPELPYTREQFATMVFAAGVAAWTAFSVWYVNAPHVLRRNLPAARIAGQTPELFPTLGTTRGFRRASDDVTVSRATAVSLYLIGSESRIWSSAGVGVLIAVLCVAAQFLPFQPPLTLMLMVPGVIAATMAAVSVRRTRLLWLRAGLERSALFAIAERLALRSIGLVAAVPVAALVTIAIFEEPSLATSVLLHAGTLIAFTLCALFTGMLFTRGPLNAIGFLLIMSVPYVLISTSLELHKAGSPFMHAGALLLFIALALLLRRLAQRRWIRLDWRLTGSPIAHYHR
jgi:hypothetical protein